MKATIQTDGGPAVPLVIYTDTPDFWRGLCARMLEQSGVTVGADGPDGPVFDLTQQQANECAGLLELAAWRIVKNFKAMSRQCEANDPPSVTMAMALGLDRSAGFVTDVSCKVSGSTKWVDDKADQQVAPPEAELPFKEGEQ